ncbi:MAG TPA: GAF domain-containing protein [Ktedonobacterales bacterium]|jgi:hypothetical protein
MSTSHLIGMTAAAKLLDVHRSTLSLAIHRHAVIPDAYTPGGHARFTLETIEAYRAQVRDGPAGSGARPRLTQLLTRALAEAVAPRNLAELAFKHLTRLFPSLTQAMVLVHVPQLANPWHVELLEEHGVQWQEAQRLGALRGTHDFAYLKVLLDGTPTICHDTHVEHIGSGTRAFVEQSHLRAFLLLPLTFGKQVLGVLELGYAEVREFPPPEVQFYSNIADLLAVAIWLWRQQHQYHDYLMAAGDMMTKGLEHRIAPTPSGGSRMERVAALLTGLAESYRTLTGAFTVICTAGPLAPGMIEDATVRGLAEQCARTGQPDKVIWLMGGREASGTGTPVPLAGGQTLGIAAGWKLPRAAWDVDLYLLQVLAGTCVLGLSPE